jgi:hypothetical protein
VPSCLGGPKNFIRRGNKFTCDMVCHEVTKAQLIYRLNNSDPSCLPALMAQKISSVAEITSPPKCFATKSH